MEKTEVIARLKSHEADIRAQGVHALYLFGSAARDEMTSASDIDLFVDHGDGFSLTDLSGLKIYLDRLFQRDVDITTRNSLHPLLKDGIVGRAERVL